MTTSRWKSGQYPTWYGQQYQHQQHVQGRLVRWPALSLSGLVVTEQSRCDDYSSRDRPNRSPIAQTNTFPLVLHIAMSLAPPTQLWKNNRR